MKGVRVQASAAVKRQQSQKNCHVRKWKNHSRSLDEQDGPAFRRIFGQAFMQGGRDLCNGDSCLRAGDVSSERKQPGWRSTQDVSVLLCGNELIKPAKIGSQRCGVPLGPGFLPVEPRSGAGILQDLHDWASLINRTKQRQPW